jgi:hypothetical protein
MKIYFVGLKPFSKFGCIKQIVQNTLIVFLDVNSCCQKYNEYKLIAPFVKEGIVKKI